MTLVIDPTTEKGKNLAEGISWAQAQLNEILSRFFNGKYRVIKGLKVQFILPTNTMSQDQIKVAIDELAPETREKFEEAVQQAGESSGLRDKKSSVGATIIDPHTGGNLLKK